MQQHCQFKYRQRILGLVKYSLRFEITPEINLLVCYQRNNVIWPLCQLSFAPLGSLPPSLARSPPSSNHHDSLPEMGPSSEGGRGRVSERRFLLAFRSRSAAPNGSGCCQPACHGCRGRLKLFKESPQCTQSLSLKPNCARCIKSQTLAVTQRNAFQSFSLRRLSVGKKVISNIILRQIASELAEEI